MTYSCGQAKPTNKNGKFLMAEKIFEKHVDRLRQACVKIMKKCRIASFHSDNQLEPVQLCRKFKIPQVLYYFNQFVWGCDL